MEKPTDNANRPEFLAFAKDSMDREAIKAFASANGWPDSCIFEGDIRVAAEYLKAHPSPLLLLVEIPSAEEAPELLDALANVCDPNTKVIVTGMVNEYSFYCWLMDIGVFNYMLRPVKKEALDAAYKKATASPAATPVKEKEPTKIIAVIGARGGVGASAIALNLAGIFAEHSDKKIALADIDPQEGTLSLALDMEPARGLRDALEKPERIDPLFIDRVMGKPHKNLWVLSAEEPLNEHIHIGADTAEALIKELCNKYNVVVMDIPRRLNPFSRECLKKAHHVLLVAELSLPSLRDTLRLSDIIVDTLKMKAPMIIANRLGLAQKNEMNIADFEKGIDAKIVEKIPYAPDIFMPISSEIPSIAHAKHAAMKPLYNLAKQLLPDILLDEKPKQANFLGFMKKSKKGG
jgi:pilus assembly protein CpaE